MDLNNATEIIQFATAALALAAGLAVATPRGWRAFIKFGKWALGINALEARVKALEDRSTGMLPVQD